jgi:ribosome-associated protein
LVTSVVAGIQEVKGSRICIVDFSAIQNSVAARFIICEGQSNTQVEAIARSVEEFTEKMYDESPWMKQGLRGGQWALLDYADVVVHIFHKDWRVHYGLEELWADAPQQVLPDVEDARPDPEDFPEY